VTIERAMSGRMTFRSLPKTGNRGLKLMERDGEAICLVVVLHVKERVEPDVTVEVDLRSEYSLQQARRGRGWKNLLDAPVPAILLQERMLEEKLAHTSANEDRNPHDVPRS
jgi:hypothetical protein